jgi:hypothetical protein
MAWISEGFGKLLCRVCQVSNIRNQRCQSYENAVRLWRVCRLDGSLLLRDVATEHVEGFSQKCLYSIDQTFYKAYCF